MGAVEKLLPVAFWLVACVAVTSVRGRSGVAEFSMNGVRGQLLFRDVVPANSTRRPWLEIDGRDVRGIALQGPFSWHVHEFPLRYSQAPGVRCASTGGHYDPDGRGRRPGYKHACTLRNRRRFHVCELGDLSGKFGALQRRVYADRSDNLTLAELIGRSVVLHRRNGKRWSCANIVEVPSSSQLWARQTGCEVRQRNTLTRTFMTRFHGSVVGELYFRQMSPARNSAGHATATRQQYQTDIPVTTVTSELWWAGAGQAGDTHSTLGLNWTIHLRPANAESVACGSGMVYTALPIGRLRVGSTPATSGHTHLHAVSRLLSPLDRVNHREVVLQDATSRRVLACGKLLEMRPAVALATFHRQIGVLRVRQDSVFDLAHVQVNLSRLANTASHLLIKETPHNDQARTVHGEPDCSDAMRSQTFNPFGIVQRYRVGTADMFPTGDLSGKFGTLHGHFAFHHAYCDSNLPLFGVHSTLGRSVLITSSGRPPLPYSCASLRKQTEPGSRVLYAVAQLTGTLVGRIEFRQTQLADGSLSDTTITIPPLQRVTPSQTVAGGDQRIPVHNFHIHIGRTGMPSALKSICDSTYVGGHFNPFNVSVDLAYKAQCSPCQPFRCELGDLAGKVGPLQVLGRTQLRVDSSLPLSGPNSVVGRSLVIHGAFGSVQPVACGNVLPMGAITAHVTFVSDSPHVDMRQFRYKVALRLHIAAGDVKFGDAFKFGRCTAVKFVLLGANARTLADSARRMDLGEYTHNQQCEHALQRNPNILFQTPKVVEWLPSWVPLPPTSGAHCRLLNARMLHLTLSFALIALIVT